MDLEDIDRLWERNVSDLILQDLYYAKQYFKYNRSDAAVTKIESALDKAETLEDTDRFSDEEAEKIISSLHILQKGLVQSVGEKPAHEKVDDIRELLIDFFRGAGGQEFTNPDVRENPGWKRYDFKIEENTLKYKGEMTGWEYSALDEFSYFIAIFEMLIYMSPERVTDVAQEFEAADMPLTKLCSGIDKIQTTLDADGESDTLRKALTYAWIGSGKSERGHHWAKIYSGNRYRMADVDVPQFVEEYLPIIFDTNEDETASPSLASGGEYKVEEMDDDKFLRWFKLNGSIGLLNKKSEFVLDSLYFTEALNLMNDIVSSWEVGSDMVDEGWEYVLTKFYKMVAAVMYGAGDLAEYKANLMDFLWDYTSSEVAEYYYEYLDLYDDRRPLGFILDDAGQVVGYDSTPNYEWRDDIDREEKEKWPVVGWDTSDTKVYVIRRQEPPESVLLLEIIDQKTGEGKVHRLDFVNVASKRDWSYVRGTCSVTADDEELYMIFEENDEKLYLTRVDPEVGEEVFSMALDDTHLNVSGELLMGSRPIAAKMMRVSALSAEDVALSIYSVYSTDVDERDIKFNVIKVNRSERQTPIELLMSFTPAPFDGYVADVLFHEIEDGDVYGVARLKEGTDDTYTTEVLFRNRSPHHSRGGYKGMKVQKEDDADLDNYYVEPMDDEMSKFKVAASYTDDNINLGSAEMTEVDLDNRDVDVSFVQQMRGIAPNRNKKRKYVSPRGIVIVGDKIMGGVIPTDVDNATREYSRMVVVSDDGVDGVYDVAASNHVDNSKIPLEVPIMLSSGGREHVVENPQWHDYDFKMDDGVLKYKGHRTAWDYVEVDESNVLEYLMDYFLYVNSEEMMGDGSLPLEFAESDIDINEFVDLLDNEDSLDKVDEALELVWFGSHFYGEPFWKGVSKDKFTKKYLPRVINDEHETLDGVDFPYSALIERGLIDWIYKNDCDYGFDDIDFHMDNVKRDPTFEVISRRAINAGVGDISDKNRMSGYEDEEGDWIYLLQKIHWITERILTGWSDYLYKSISDDVAECAMDFLSARGVRASKSPVEAVVYLGDSEEGEIVCIRQDEMEVAWRTSIPNQIEYLEDYNIRKISDWKVIDDYIIVTVARDPVKPAEEVESSTTMYDEIIKIDTLTGAVVDYGGKTANSFWHLIGVYRTDTDTDEDEIVVLTKDTNDDTGYYFEFLSLKDLSAKYSWSLPDEVEEVTWVTEGPYMFPKKTFFQYDEDVFLKGEQCVAFVAHLSSHDDNEGVILIYDLVEDEVVGRLCTTNDRPTHIFPYSFPGGPRVRGLAAVEYMDDLKPGDAPPSQDDLTNRIEFFQSVYEGKNAKNRVSEEDYTFDNVPLSYYRAVIDITMDGRVYTLESSIDPASVSGDKHGGTFGFDSNYNLRLRDRQGEVWSLAAGSKLLAGMDIDDIGYSRGSGNLFFTLKSGPKSLSEGKIPALIKLAGNDGDFLGKWNFKDEDKRFDEVLIDD